VLLAIDVGNTHTTCGLFRDGALVHTFRAETRPSRTADEHAALLRQLLALRGLEPAGVDEAILASVVPPVTEVLLEAIRLAFACEALVVGPGIRTGISVVSQSSREVGADRIVNAVAVHDVAPTDHGAIVVDFGTATTFDCVSPKGEFLGGAIAPGVQVSLDALVSHAAKLHPVEIVAPPQVLGRNTTHAIQSGVVHGYASLVEGLVEKLKKELGFPCNVVATGGFATLIAQHSRCFDGVEPELTLRGLCILHERNKPLHKKPAAVERPPRAH
jgi:type III pantothenate kinase